jgi:hypothetical protein
MSLGAISQQFLREVETATGLPVHVEADERLQPPLLARVQLARRGAPLHRVTYHPNARAMADYLIASQCAFVLRLHALPAAERLELTDAPVADRDALAWVRAFPPSATLPPDRQAAFAEFLRTSLLSMVRSVPVGFRVDLDLRTRFPELQAAQEQATRRQIDTHASVLTPEVRRNIPEVPLRLNLAINAAFAQFWGRELNEPGWTLPYLTAGALAQGEALLARSEELPLGPAQDRALIQAWADELGLGAWLRWVPHTA